jgi:Cd2+/Zn2+-exporting ATPase
MSAEEQLLKQEDQSCVKLIDEAVTGETGIYQVALDTEQQTVTFDYDPAQIAEPQLNRIAQNISPRLEQRWQTCTLRLDRRGGRACESCALALEQQLGRLPGVQRARASFAGGVLSVAYNDALLTPADISRRVEQLGVSVQPSASEWPPVEEAAASAPAGANRLWAWFKRQNPEAILTAITLLAMASALIVERRAGPPLLAAALYVVAYVAGGVYGLKAGIQSLRARTIDVDLLMVLAALGAAVVGEPFEGAMLLFLFSLSNVLQAYALDRTRNAIRALMKLRPEQALVRRGDRLVALPINQIHVGDRVVVKPGERIPLDGVVVEGTSSVNQAPITGESIPVDKAQGDTVFAGTINENGSLEIGVTKLAKDSTIARLIKLVEEAQSEKAETQRFIDRAEQYYAIGVIAFTALAIAVPLLFSQMPFDAIFYQAMTIMVAASPCAIVISTPATVLSAIGNGARRGVLFKGGVHVENAATIKVITFDKTGTLTAGKPEVTDVRPLTAGEPKASTPSREDELLRLAAAVEARSEHPLAQAVVMAAHRRALDIPEVSSFEAFTGQGVRATLDDTGGQSRAIREIHIGNLRYFATYEGPELDAARAMVKELEADGKTSVIVAQLEDGRLLHVLGVIGMADVLRLDAAGVVAELKAAGIERVIMLTGDNETVARHIATAAGVDEFYAGLLPEDKVRVVKELGEKYGPVAMVGDGVNDAPALAAASLGIAMGAAGTDVALETADVVLMSDDLKKLPYMIRLSRKTRQTLIVNLGFALFMILLMLTAIFVRDLPLPAAVIGHEGGTVLVSLNGLRLLAYRRK